MIGIYKAEIGGEGEYQVHERLNKNAHQSEIDGRFLCMFIGATSESLLSSRKQTHRVYRSLFVVDPHLSQ